MRLFATRFCAAVLQGARSGEREQQLKQEQGQTQWEDHDGAAYYRLTYVGVGGIERGAWRPVALCSKLVDEGFAICLARSRSACARMCLRA